MPAALLLALTILLTGIAAPAALAQGAKVARVGLVGLTEGECSNQAFREGMRDLGYREGGNLVISTSRGWTPAPSPPR